MAIRGVDGEIINADIFSLAFSIGADSAHVFAVMIESVDTFFPYFIQYVDIVVHTFNFVHVGDDAVSACVQHHPFLSLEEVMKENKAINLFPQL